MAARNDKTVNGRGWGEVAYALGVGRSQFRENFGRVHDVEVVDGTAWAGAFSDDPIRSAGCRQVTELFSSGHVYGQRGGGRVVGLLGWGCCEVEVCLFKEGCDTVSCLWVGKGGVGEGWLVGGDQKGG